MSEPTTRRAAREAASTRRLPRLPSPRLPRSRGRGRAPRRRRRSERERNTLLVRVAAVAILVLALSVNVVAPRVARVLGYELVAIVGGSMEPTIARDSLVLVRTEGFTPRSGDVVSFTAPGGSELTTHRVVKVLEDGSVVTRGDANQADDALPSARSDVKAVLVSGLGPLAEPLYAATTVGGRLVAVVAAVALLGFARTRDEPRAGTVAGGPSDGYATD